MAAQRAEAGMHFIRDRTRMRPRRFVLRPECGSGKRLGQIFDDRERFPNLDVAVEQDGDFAVEARADALLEVRRLELDQLLGERNPGRLHRDPWPERPGRVVLVADDERKPHGRRSAFPHMLPSAPGYTTLSPDSSGS